MFISLYKNKNHCPYHTYFFVRVVDQGQVSVTLADGMMLMP